MENPKKQLTLDEFRLRARQLGLQVPRNRLRELYDGFAYVNALAQRVRKALDTTDEPANVFRIHEAGS